MDRRVDLIKSIDAAVERLLDMRALLLKDLSNSEIVNGNKGLDSKDSKALAEDVMPELFLGRLTIEQSKVYREGVEIGIFK